MHRSLLHSALSAGLLFASQSVLTSAADIDILAGQHIVYSFPASSQPPDELLTLTKQGLVGGVILFGENVDGNTAAAMRALKDAYAASPAPKLLRDKTGKDAHFLVTTDQEGGKVRRIKGAAPEQSAKQMGASSDPAGAGKTAGEGAAQVLAEYENNANLAPVLGVHRHEGDFLDAFERSFGNNSKAVITPAIPFIQAQQAGGVAAAAKHFPGLGAALKNDNTDEKPVTIDLPLDELRAVDQAPYAAAIKAGVDMVMASWAVYPALDTLPAGLSSKWIKDELRTRLGFKGVTITDALEAGSLKPVGDLGTVSTMAAAAGMDMLLASGRDVSQGETVRKAVVAALQGGDLDQNEFDAATARIADLRSRINA